MDGCSPHWRFVSSSSCGERVLELGIRSVHFLTMSSVLSMTTAIAYACSRVKLKNVGLLRACQVCPAQPLRMPNPLSYASTPCAGCWTAIRVPGTGVASTGSCLVAGFQQRSLTKDSGSGLAASMATTHSQARFMWGSDSPR